MRINEIAKHFNIKTNKLRFYEKKGLLSPKRDHNGYRIYEKKDLLRLQMILTYRTLDIPVEVIEKILDGQNADNHLNQLLNQWNLVNDQLNKYRVIKRSLEGVLDDALKDRSGLIETDTLLAIGEEINSYTRIQNNWEDKWSFDEWAERYDLTVAKDENCLHLYRHYEVLLERVFEISLEGLYENSKVLDIGVGTGNLASEYLKAGLQVVGVDQSRQMLYVAKKKNPDLNLKLGEFLKLPFIDEKFDLIVSTYAFHHLKRDEKKIALDEMFRVLKEDASIIIGDLMFKNEAARKTYLKSATEEERFSIEDEYYTDIEWLLGYLQKFGCKCSHTQVDDLLHIVKISRI